jgi:hypothetical protein
MDDDFIIETIARRISDECPWTDAKKMLDHIGWRDVVTHLYTDKKLRGALIEAYTAELANARAAQLLESESDSVPW